MQFRAKTTKTPVTLDITPMVDVVFLLLLFFMVTTTFASINDIKLNLPQAKTGDALSSDSERIVVTLDRSGNLTVQGHSVSLENLGENLLKAAGGDLQQVIFIEADEAASHGRVVAILDASRQQGFSRLAIAAQAGFEKK
ncbi:MAG: biopolymer transporter ExbD [Magnetococcales bacterium]|nr:biopolymer transporter ExbD [Magnetococcales bacterium]